ncbi:unnamed protein product [Citrullus colocynthis]|uniref:Uncharacterized protein n=1 Tax=Citrullus colocynthis TaxID=252529 RepID=A0ABP0XLZ7_9ROSI
MVQCYDMIRISSSSTCLLELNSTISAVAKEQDSICWISMCINKLINFSHGRCKIVWRPFRDWKFGVAYCDKSDMFTYIMNRSIVLDVVYKIVMSGCFYAEGTLLAFEKLSLSKISLTQHATIDSN